MISCYANLIACCLSLKTHAQCSTQPVHPVVRQPAYKRTNDDHQPNLITSTVGTRTLAVHGQQSAIVVELRDNRRKRRLSVIGHDSEHTVLRAVVAHAGERRVCCGADAIILLRPQGRERGPRLGELGRSLQRNAEDVGRSEECARQRLAAACVRGAQWCREAQRTQ
jgi:hypothetical protein